MSIRFVSVSLRIVCAHVRQSFLRLCERLIGRHDRTAIIARSLCRMEEAIFREVVGGGEAQQTLRGDSLM